MLSKAIMSAAKETLDFVNNKYPDIQEAEIIDSNHLFTQRDCICHAKFLPGSVEELVRDSDELRAMRRLACAQGLLLGARVCGTFSFYVINKRMTDIKNAA